MSVPHCPDCDSTLTNDEGAHGLLICAGCGRTAVAEDAGSITLISQHYGRREALESIVLTPAFRKRYSLGTVLGSGAMGMVVQATDRGTGQRVAVKFFTLVGDKTALARFVQEGQVLRQIAHPNIVQVLESGEVGGHPYLTIELLEGGTLRSRMDRRPGFTPSGRCAWRGSAWPVWRPATTAASCTGT